jgi:anaerobic selenocysteine-containing dehydrogenase
MEPTSEIRTTCPRDCYDACGIVVKHYSSGEVSVVGNPHHHRSNGALCGKCSIGYNGVWRDPAIRLTRPLRRAGPKGEGVFEPVSWETALGEIAPKLANIIASSGGESVLHTHYTGTCSLIAGNFPLRFFNRIGATEVDPDTVCNKAGHVALQLMYGTSTLGFDSRTVSDARSIMVWGANPSATAPHIDRYWLREFRGPKIVVDPIRHATAAAADIHLQLYPGTDGALAFAIMHVIRANGRFDQNFLDAHTTGFREVARQLDTCTPQWGEAATGVPARLIEKAALLYAGGPSLLWLGQGFQRQSFGGNAMRAAAMLPAVTGNIGRRGSGFLYLNGSDSRGIDTSYLTSPHLNRGGPHSISHMDLASRLEDSSARVLFTWNNNIAASSPEQARLRKALAREDLLQVTIDLFQTDTADFADYILPAASFLEFDDVVMSYFDHTLSAQAKALDAPGEALPNQEIFRRLSRMMGFSDGELYEADRSIIASLLRQAGTSLNFEELAHLGTVHLPEKPVIQFEDLKFPTPTGKIRIAGDCFVEAGLPSAPFPSAEPRPKMGELRLLSPASEWLMNSSFGNEAKVQRQLGDRSAFLNQSDAAQLNLKEGETVEIRNETWTLWARAGVSPDVPAGVVLLHKSRWPKSDAARANVNILNPGRKADLAGSCAVHSIDVMVTRVPAAPLAAGDGSR